MKKLTKFFALTLAVMVLSFALTACEKPSERYARVIEIKPEVSYGYTAISSNSVTKDFEIYNYKALVSELVKNKHISTNTFDQKLVGNDIYFFFGNYIYFFYQYDSRGSTKYKYDKENYINKPILNEHRFDVGLFRVDINTCKCEVVYDFKDVYPTSVRDLKSPSVGTIVDENRAVLYYNGMIKIMNLNTLEITDSVDVYDKEQFTTSEKCPYYLNEFYDYVKFNENTLDYYELDGYSFKLHQYEITGGIKATRFENYIYTHGYGGSIYDCYDFTTDEKIDINFFTNKIEEFKNKKSEEEYQNRGEEDAYIVGGKKYYLYFFRSGLTIFTESEYIKNEDNEIVYNENRKVLCAIDEEFLIENSQAFNDLYYLWDKNPKEYQVKKFWVIDGKLFVAVSANCSLAGRTPSYIFECDIENNKAYYVGFVDNASYIYGCILQVNY